MAFIEYPFDWYRYTPLPQVQKWVAQFFDEEEKYFFDLMEEAINTQQNDILDILISTGAIKCEWLFNNRNLLEIALASPVEFNLLLDKIFELPFPKDRDYLSIVFQDENLYLVEQLIKHGFASTPKQQQILTDGFYYLLARGMHIEHLQLIVSKEFILSQRVSIELTVFRGKIRSFENWRKRVVTEGTQGNLLEAAIFHNAIRAVKYLLSLHFPYSEDYLLTALNRGFYTIAQYIINEYPKSVKIKLLKVLWKILDEEIFIDSGPKVLDLILSKLEDQKDYDIFPIWIAQVPKAIPLFIKYGYEINFDLIANLDLSLEAFELAYANSNLGMSKLDFLIQTDYYDYIEMYANEEITVFNINTLRYLMKIRDRERFAEIKRKYRININEQKESNFTLLEHAIIDGDHEGIDFLVDQGVEINPENPFIRDSLTYYLLTDIAITKKMINHGFNINSKFNYEQKFIRPIEFLVEENDVEGVKLLIDNGAKVDVIVEPQNDPLILVAASENKMEIVKLMLPFTNHINTIDVYGNSLLAYIICFGKDDPEFLQDFLNRKPNLDVIIEIFPPVIYAVTCGNIKYMELLVHAGCNINEVVNETITVMSYLRNPKDVELALKLGFNTTWIYEDQNDVRGVVNTAIMMAIQHLEENELLAIQYLPKQIDFVSNGMNHLVITNSARVVKTLIRAGAKLDIIIDNLFNALDIALMNKRDPAISLMLLEVGLRPIIETDEAPPIFQEALVFWSKSEGERREYKVEQITQLCPLYREEILLSQFEIRNRREGIYLPSEIIKMIQMMF